LLEGLDGINKMSKSLGNYIGINEAADEMFGKVMSISDDLMWRYFELLSFRPLAEIAQLGRSVGEGRNPRDVKFELAQELVDRFHHKGAGQRAQTAFLERFAQKSLPTDLPLTRVETADADIALGAALAAAQLVSSGSEARRKIAEGAVRIDGEKVTDAATRLKLGTACILQVGPRRFARISVEKK
jgi:tyrosyl-tRNA synthetase